MNPPTPSTAAVPVQRHTASPRWSPSQQSELNALLSGQWWPFHQADPKVLGYLHQKHKQDMINNAERAWL